MTLNAESLLEGLRGFSDPYITDRDLVSRKAIRDVDIQDDGGQQRVHLRLALGYPAAGIADSLRQALRERVMALGNISSVEIELDWAVIANKTQHNMKSMEGIKNIVAVASGKGGVGKSTTSVNLALALAAEGARVGLLDADIYGPSQPIMLGIGKDVRPQQKDAEHFLPIMAHGLQTMSMGYLVTEKTPMVWRGPMVSGALQQMLTQTYWDDLDYLIVDMPPGTGDIQLTLSQKVPVTGAVIVTTPQDIALLDAIKGIEMFRKVDIPVIGVVENMALHVCSQCGHTEHIFGEGGAQRLVSEYQTTLLGQLPLDIHIRQQSDNGVPVVVADPESELALRYRDMARRLGAALAQRGKNYANVFPNIVVKND